MKESHFKGKILLEEIDFRIALSALSVAAAITAMYHKSVANKSGNNFNDSSEGSFSFWFVRAIAFSLGGLVVAYLVAPATINWASIVIPLWARWLGFLIGLLGVALLHWSLKSLGKNLTGTIAVRDQATLVTTGPYAYVRHPYYVAAGIIIMSVAVLSSNAAIAVNGGTLWIFLAVRTAQEEQILIRVFGDQYRSYRQRTGMFLPRILQGNTNND